MRVEHDEAQRTVVVRRGSHVVAVNLAADARTVAVGGAPAELAVLLAWEPGGTALDGTRVTLPAESAAVLGPA